MLKFHSSKRAKPQNRTEVSPTTMECSTVELELPFVYLISFSGISFLIFFFWGILRNPPEKTILFLVSFFSFSFFVLKKEIPRKKN